MSRTVLYDKSWQEAEPTVPGGGRMHYVVEASAPDKATGEENYYVFVNEENRSNGKVATRDSVMLDERDLDLMIAALIEARNAIARTKARDAEKLAHKEEPS